MPIATPTPTLFATGDITRDREDTNRKFAMLGNHFCGRWGGNKLVVLTMSMTLFPTPICSSFAVLNRNVRRPNGTGNGTGGMHHMNNTAAAAAAAAAAGKQVNKVKPTVNVSRQVEGQVISPSQYNR